MSSSHRAAPVNSIVLGIAVILSAVLLLSLSDALVKLASARLSVGQLFLVRSSVAVFLMAGYALAMSRMSRLRLVRPRWVVLRSLLLTSMWVAYYAALPSMSFALAAAALYTTPLFMALFSCILLKEPIRPRRWLAIAIGIVGVLLMLRPDTNTVSPIIALPFLAAIFYALAAIVTWSRCAKEKPLALAMNLNLCLAVAGAVTLAAILLLAPSPDLVADNAFIMSLWPMLEPSDLLLLAVLGLFMVAIAILVAKAYQMAPSPVIGVFDNGYLVFATLWSALFFDEIPDAVGFFGIAMIICAAILSITSGHSRREPG